MTTIVTFTQGPSIGFKATKVRLSLQLTQQELANIAGISKDDVDFFEHNLPIPLDIKRKLLSALWVTRKAGKF
ncbi:hypothetical protein ACFLUZ_07475 [Chloroflexota bacterium]